MDNDISLQQLKNRVREFCEERDWDQFHGPKDLAIGLVTESAELLDLFRFKTESQVTEMFASDGKRGAVADELADAFFFLLRFAQKFGIDLETALEQKIAKNASKYPVEKAKGRNSKYDEL